MKKFSVYLIVIGMLGLFGPFLGVVLKGSESVSSSMTIGSVLIVVGLILFGTTNYFSKS